MAKCLDNVKIIKELRRNDGYVCRRLNSKILYITGCTSTKCKEPSLIPAYTRYEGDASKRMLSFFKDNCVFHKEGRIIDLYVLSAGYGFIPADQVIQNYDVTFQKTSISLKKEMAQKLELRVDFSKLLNQGYKLIILRLGGEYIKALNSVAPKDGYVIPEGTKICYLETSNKIKVPKEVECLVEIKVSEKERNSYGGKISYQDCIWSKFFEKNKNKSVNDIINKINNVKNVEELLK